jgi:hypothetical protein
MKAKCILWLLAGFVLFFGCSKPAQNPGVPSQEDAEAFVLYEKGQELGVLLTEASLMLLREDGKMEWKANLNAGDTVVWKDEKKDAVRAYDGVTRTFYRVEMEGDYWVQDYAIAGPAVPAVITADETVLYTKPDLTSVARRGSISIPKYTLVALLDDNDPTDQFVKITARVEGAANPSISELYVKLENISSDYNDVGCAKLARIASLTTNPASRKELLKNAIQMAEKGSRFYHVAGGLNDDPALFELELTDNLERLDNQVHYRVTSDTVNIRDLPSVNSNVTGTMTEGDDFWVSLRTKREISLPAAEEGADPIKGRWLRTENGNWVFSAYVTPASPF